MRKNKILFISLVIFLPFFPLTVNATTYYVDYRDGLDSNDGLSEVKPRKTVSMSLSGGDIVYFKRGVTYGADINLGYSGTERTYGTNASIGATGYVMTVSGETFQSEGVQAGDRVYLNGEGLFTVASVDSQTQITLTDPTLHKSLSGVAYSITNPITLTIKTTWGTTGSAKFTGQIKLDGRSNIVIDGGISQEIELTGHTKWGVVAYNTSIKRNIFLRNLYIHHLGGYVYSGSNQSGGIWFEDVQNGLVESCKIYYAGVKDDGYYHDYGIWVTSDSYYVTISGNDVSYSGDDGINFSGCRDCYVQFNESYQHYSTEGYDGFQCVGFSLVPYKVWVRYNKFHDNGQNMYFTGYEYIVYSNLFYYTSAMAGSQQVNVVMSYYSRGKFYNNIVAFGGSLGGLRIKAQDGDKSPASSPHDIRNNIFYENDASNKGGQEVQFNITTGGILNNNVYVRKDKPVTNDLLVEWGSNKYSLASLCSSVGQECGGKQCTASKCDWTWQNPGVFVDGTRSSSPDFHPAENNSPQANAGTDVGLQFYMDKVKMSIPPYIGAYGLGTASSNISSNRQPDPPSGLIIR